MAAATLNQTVALVVRATRGAVRGAWEGGIAELIAWLRRCTQWRAGPGWYAAALLLTLGINAWAAGLAVLFGAPVPTTTLLARWPEMLLRPSALRGQRITDVGMLPIASALMITYVRLGQPE